MNTPTAIILSVEVMLYNRCMPNYRRVKIEGGTYFFTLVTNNRIKVFRSSDTRELLLKAFDHVKRFHPFVMEAYCILPEHIHLLCRMPEDDDNYSLRIAEIKKRFSKTYYNEIGTTLSKDSIQIKRGESAVWQRRFWEHYIRDEGDLHNHLDYIHFNPVKHKLVNQVSEWPSSSFFDYVKMGCYDISWGTEYQDIDDLQFGE